MHHRPRPHSTWTVAIVFTMIAALFAAVGSSPAAAQAGPVITNPGPQAHDVGHRACTALRTNVRADDWAVQGLPPGIRISPQQDGIATREDESLTLRLDGTPTRTGDYTVRVSAIAAGVAGPQIEIPYRVFSPDPSVPVIKAGRFHRAFTIDCFSQGWVANDFISNPANFGPAGRVRLPSGLPIHEQTSEIYNSSRFITAAYLADADILFDGFVGDFDNTEYTRAELRLVKQWVENDGGVLITTADHQGADGLAQLFGVRTDGFFISAPGGPFTHCGSVDPELERPEPPCPQFTAASTTHPIVDGPFERWRSLDTDGTVGYLQRNIRGWNRVANHPNGRPAIIERKAGNGHVVVISDEGTLRMNLTNPAGRLLDNGRFLGNLVAFAIDKVSTVPEANNDVLVGRAFRRFNANVCRNDVSPDGRRSVRLTSGSLGPDLRMRGCRITGTPRTLGNWQAEYTFTDSDGQTDTAYISVTINGEFGPAASNPTCAGRPATIVGTPGDDIIRGTNGNDVIVGGRGNDIIRGLRGNDIICGGPGNDTIIGGPGRDRCIGGPGRDTIRGCQLRR